MVELIYLHVCDHALRPLVLSPVDAAHRTVSTFSPLARPPARPPPAEEEGEGCCASPIARALGKLALLLFVGLPFVAALI